MKSDSKMYQKVIEVFKRCIDAVRDGTVEIKAIAIEPGKAVYVAVTATDHQSNAVDLCCKAKALERVSSELGKERVTVTKWSESLETYIRSSLVVSGRLANISRRPPNVIVNEAERQATVIVDAATFRDLMEDGQLRLKLAERLVGYSLNLQEARE
jgi:N utilization substance protein A